MPPRARQVDVAARCGVSVPTVSRILSDPNDPEFRPETRAKVVAAAEALGYRPNSHAHALLTGKSHVVGVSCGFALDLNFSKAVAEAERVVTAHGHHMLLHVLAGMEDWYELLARNRVDFLVALTERRLAEALKAWNPALLDRIVFVGSRGASGPAAAVSYTWDDREGGRLAPEYLIRKGHRKIALLAGQMPESKVGAAREALAAAGLEIREVTVADEADRRAAGRELAACALARYPDTTALFVRSCVLVPGVYAEIRSRGLRIPEDISVMACYDHQNVFAFDPPLTCTRFPIVQAIQAALLDYFAEGERRGRHFECSIVERESVAAI